MNGMLDLHFTIENPTTKNKFNIKCQIPSDASQMTIAELEAHYGKKLVNTIYDLLNHKPLKKELEKPVLILSN